MSLAVTKRNPSQLGPDQLQFGLGLFNEESIESIVNELRRERG